MTKAEKKLRKAMRQLNKAFSEVCAEQGYEYSGRFSAFGDTIVRNNSIAMVTQIDLQGTADRHIFAGVWIEDDELKEWRKR